jgi:hypothetical protein
MSLEIRRIAPIRAANVVAVLNFVVFLVVAVMMLMTAGLTAPPTMDAAQRASFERMMRFLILGYPFLGAIFGWIFAALGAVIYNVMAPRIGGLLIEVGESNPAAAGPTV